MASLDDDEVNRRQDAPKSTREEEEEAWRNEDEYRRFVEEEREAENRQSAIDEMVSWFEFQFEDPANETPVDEGEYIYVFGGPFDARDVLGDNFGTSYDDEWIEAAVEQVQSGGTYEWAPSSKGEYYEHPEPDDKELAEVVTSEFRGQILDRLEALEAQLKGLSNEPPPIGHNYPPDEVGLPPYDDEGKQALQDAISIARREVSAEEPDSTKLRNSETTFVQVGKSILQWVARKMDLVVDESIKNGIKLVIWAEVGRELLSLASDIAKIIQHI